MADFTVDIGGLDALSTNLDRTVDNIDSASTRLADAGTDTVGTDRLDTACEDFRSDWKGGLDLLREAVHEISGGLDAAKKTYAELEADIANNLGTMAETMGGAEGSAAP